MRPFFCLLAVAAALGVAGCGQLDFTPEGDPSRVLTGQVDIDGNSALPPDAVVTVRVVDASAVGMPPQVIGAQTINNPGSAPIAFRVLYRADDELLRKGLNIEARVSFGGKIRFFNLNRYAVTLGNAADPHRITVNPSGP
jgi:putative lipoprotein